MDTVGALLLGAKANGCCELDKGRLVLDLLGFLDGSGDTLEVVVTIGHGQSVPAVRLVALEDILGEGNVGVTVNGDMVVVPDGDEVAQLKVTSERGSFARYTLLEASITKEGICVVIDEVETGLVESGSSLCLCDGKTNSVADTLAKRSSGDFDAGGVVGLGMAGGNAVDSLWRKDKSELAKDKRGCKILTRKAFRSSMVRP